MTQQQLFDLHDRVAVVTGALGRLGGVFCEALLEANARVASLDLPTARVPPRFASLQRQHGERLAFFPADVTCRDSLDRAVAAIRGRMGCPVVLVNNAGIDQPPQTPKTTCRLEDIPVEASRGILEVNLLGLFSCCQAFLPALRESGHGSIINIGSLYASVSPDARLYEHLPCSPPLLKPPLYGASKAAVVNLTKYLAAHLGPDGVRVNALSPGGVSGGQDDEFVKKFSARVPLGRMAKPADLVGPLVFLAADASAYVTGIELRVDGGFTVW